MLRRRHEIRRVLLVGGLAAVVGAGMWLGAGSKTADPARHASEVAVHNTAADCVRPRSSATIGPVITNGPDGAPRVNPFAGMSDAQQRNLMLQETQAWNQRYIAWVASLDLSSLNLSALAVVPSSGDTLGPPAKTLSAAVASADVIVEGTVEAETSSPAFFTDAVVSVSAQLKGSVAATTSVVLGWYLQPTTDWSSEFIVQDPGQPLVFPSDQVILFLTRDPTGAYWAQAFSGFPVINGEVANPWAGGACAPEASFAQQIVAAVNSG